MTQVKKLYGDTVQRRSVTITDGINKGIMNLISFLYRNDIQIDYTTSLNFVAHMGLLALSKKVEKGIKGKTKQILVAYVDYDALKKEAILDEWYEYHTLL
ncbi:MAG: hypothetical protein ACRD32_08405, partial [Nitrososphaerales archaeon]